MSNKNENQNTSNGVNTKKKSTTTKTMNVSVRLEIKPDGRAVWDVNDVHKLLAKQIVNDPKLDKVNRLVKKDPSAISLEEIRKEKKSKEDKVEIPDPQEILENAEQKN